jgi:MFS family permease
MTKQGGVLKPDVRLLFATRILRMFAYGLLSVILALYLSEVGLSTRQIGALLTLTLVGDTVISLWMTTAADRIGRRKMLIVGAVLMVLAGIAFALSRNFAILLVAAIVGVISPSGNEVGPFLSIEQAALSQSVAREQRTHLFAWYNLAGSFAGAVGSLAGGGLSQLAHSFGTSPLGGYRVVVILYGGIGLLLAMALTRLSRSAEAEDTAEMAAGLKKTFLGLHQSRCVIFKLSALFALDAFAGGFVMQTLIAYWFNVRFGLSPALLGTIFFGANILAGISALYASKIASRIGMINTMVFTHIPSNILLILVPLMPNATLAITVLLMRFAISQMDVPTRQSYTMSVVHPAERAAAAGVTGMARTTGAALSPIIVGALFASTSLLSVPFFLAGGLKLVYDLLLYRSFRSVSNPH